MQPRVIRTKQHFLSCRDITSTAGSPSNTNLPSLHPACLQTAFAPGISRDRQVRLLHLQSVWPGGTGVTCARCETERLSSRTVPSSHPCTRTRDLWMAAWWRGLDLVNEYWGQPPCCHPVTWVKHVTKCKVNIFCKQKLTWMDRHWNLWRPQLVDEFRWYANEVLSCQRGHTEDVTTTEVLASFR